MAMRRRSRRRYEAPVPPPPPQSRGYQLLDQATNMRVAWGGPNPIFEPEKAIEYNERLVELYKQTAEAFRQEGNDYGRGIAEGWIPQIEETNRMIRSRYIERRGEQLELLKNAGAGQVDPNTLLAVIQPENVVRADNPLDPNLAESDEIQHGVSGTARVAEAEICDSRQCELAHFLVRGDYVEFVSTEQVKRVGKHPLDDRAMPSDIKLPARYVLVHDATGTILTPCDLYAVKWHGTRKRNLQEIANDDLAVAQDYFGNADLRMGSVDIPDGPWTRAVKVKFIRYRRYGFANHFEHEYTPAVDLFHSQRPLAWKLQLPEGCVVSDRGFEVP